MDFIKENKVAISSAALMITLFGGGHMIQTVHAEGNTNTPTATQTTNTISVADTSREDSSSVTNVETKPEHATTALRTHMEASSDSESHTDKAPVVNSPSATNPSITNTTTASPSIAPQTHFSVQGAGGDDGDDDSPTTNHSRHSEEQEGFDD